MATSSVRSRGGAVPAWVFAFWFRHAHSSPRQPVVGIDAGCQRYCASSSPRNLQRGL